MSHIPSTIPPSNFQLTFSHALRTYMKRTREDLLLHPLAARLQTCDSPHATLSVLQDQAKPFGHSPSSEEGLTRWLVPTVNVLYSLSISVGEDIGLVLSPAKAIFVGTGVLLLAAQSVGTTQDTLLDVFSQMELFFRRLEAYPEITNAKSMKDINEKIMLAVLSILTIATEEIKQGRAKRYFRKLVGRTVIGDMIQRLDRLTLEEAQMVNEVLNISHGATGPSHIMMPHAGKSNHPPTPYALTNGVSNTLLSPRGQLLSDIRKWLSPPDPSTNYSTACQARRQGTAEWFLQGSTFKQWKSSGSSLLWIQGKPGSGKSVLCSAIVKDIENLCKAGPALMAYFFFDVKDNKKQSRLDMILSLLTQLSARSNHCRDILCRLYLTHRRGVQMPTHGVLTECLKNMLSLPSQVPTYIILDAVDGCPNNPGVPSPREEILELLEKLISLRIPNLRLSITSRPEIGIRTYLEPLEPLVVSLHDEMGQKRDIVEYIRAAVYSDRSIRKWREEDQELVIDLLSGRADGMFQWVSCQVDTIRHSSPSRLRRILGELPNALEETYERVLMEISISKRKHALRLFQCLTASTRPLRVEELAEVLAIDFEGAIPKLNVDWRWDGQEQSVLSACSSLVSVVQNTNGSRVVQFSHWSVKEFLTSPRIAASSERVSFYHVQLESAHTTLARACLGVLLRLDDSINKDSIKGFPLAEYAARHWVDHAKFGNVSSHLQVSMEALFDSEKPHFAAWVWIHDVDEVPCAPTEHPTRPQANTLYYSTLCGFHRLTEHLIVDCHMDVNARGGLFVTPLHAALYMGHIAIAVLLIEHGAEANAWDDVDPTPLFLALHNGNFEVVQPLLAHGANANVQDDKRATPLHIASRSGYSNAVQWLLEYGAKIDAQDCEDRTPLHIASGNGRFDAVRTLLEHGANVTSRNNKGLTPLHLVSVKGTLEIAKLLVEHGADVDARDDTDSTSLHLASVNGNQKVVEFLIQHGADVTARDHRMSTSLHLASLNGHSGVAEPLVHFGADVNARDDKRWTPLHLASEDGNLELVDLLIQFGADVHAQDIKGSTALHLASRRGPSDLVKLLLERGAGPNAQNDRGWTPLHIATREGVVDVMLCLLALGADVALRDGEGRTALHMASNDNDSEVVHLLIEHGADPYVRDNNNS